MSLQIATLIQRCAPSPTRVPMIGRAGKWRPRKAVGPGRSMETTLVALDFSCMSRVRDRIIQPRALLFSSRTVSLEGPVWCIFFTKCHLKGCQGGFVHPTPIFSKVGFLWYLCLWPANLKWSIFFWVSMFTTRTIWKEKVMTPHLSKLWISKNN